jgi:hypothetical protein
MTINSIKSLAVVTLTALFIVGAPMPVSAQKAKKEKAKKEKVTDPRLLTVTKMSKMTKESQFLTKGVALKTAHRATQGFSISADERTMWFSQPGSFGKNQPGLTKVHENYIVRRQDGKRESMTLRYFGNANSLAVEHGEDGKDYIWIGSNATKYKGSYSRTRTVSRFPFEVNGEINEGYAGENYYMGGERYCYPAVNPAADILGIVTQKAGAVTVNLYNLTEARALDNTDVKLKTVYKGEVVGEPEQTVVRTIKAKDMTTAEAISSFTIAKPDKETADPAKVPNYYTFRAWDVDKDYVYFVEGQHNKGSMKNGESKAFITIYDHSGRVVMPKRRIQCVFYQYLLESLGITPAGYADIAGIKVIDSKIYVMFSVKDGKGFKTVVVKHE